MLETRNLRLTSQESKNMDVKNEKMPTSISDSPNMDVKHGKNFFSDSPNRNDWAEELLLGQ